ncbi:putative reverse transcriptase domain-containing protein, partial [Tanacetum coccineum]
MSTAYHPETDGQSERTIQTLEDMLQACVIEFGKDGKDTYPWYNSHTIIVTMLVSRQHHLRHFMVEMQIRQRLQAARDRQRSYANIRQKPLELQVRDCVMLKVSPPKGVIRFGKLGKLNP